MGELLKSNKSFQLNVASKPQHKLVGFKIESIDYIHHSFIDQLKFIEIEGKDNDFDIDIYEDGRYLVCFLPKPQQIPSEQSLQIKVSLKVKDKLMDDFDVADFEVVRDA